jgi:hypothetical protein
LHTRGKQQGLLAIGFWFVKYGVATPDEKKHAATSDGEEKRSHHHARRRIARVRTLAAVLHAVFAKANVFQRSLARGIGGVFVRGLPLTDLGHNAVQKRRVGIQRREVAVHKAVVAKAGAGAWRVDPTRADSVLRGQPNAARDCKENHTQTTAKHRALVRAIVSVRIRTWHFFECPVTHKMVHHHTPTNRKEKGFAL